MNNEDVTLVEAEFKKMQELEWLPLHDEIK
jgi:hypothetical protein